jgi:hypothetical protein
MTVSKVKPVLGAPSSASSPQNAPDSGQREGEGDHWCLPSGQPLVEFALSAGLLAPGLVRLAEAHAAETPGIEMDLNLPAQDSLLAEQAERGAQAVPRLVKSGTGRYPKESESVR